MGKKSEAVNRPCPCGLAAAYDACCGRYIDAGRPAPDPLALMRSRYSAYSLGHVEYLQATWHPSTRPPTLSVDPKARWFRLDIVAAADDTVEFIARYKSNGKAHRLHERSRFRREAGRWYYLDGDQIA